MKILALDTTTDVSSIALADERGMLGEYNAAHKMDLSQRLLPNINTLLKDCGVEMKDLDAISVSLGPGSFTGIRIGVVTAKTLAQTLGIRMAGLVSLDVLAHQFDCLPHKLVCPIIKVRKGEVYYALYRTHSGGMERISEYQAETVESLIEYAGQIEGGEIIFCGDALESNIDALRNGLKDRAVPAAKWLCYPKASVLARLGAEKIAAGMDENPLSLVPFYIRKSTPEMVLEAKG
ncbi:MAG TPA: tRNA (adenosine(37)-N6)-threonylcarbamoyltransferase complex dimerization subunit type 1 TsaB [Armatimonadota bacterium]|jgi:tRNA threonylcarbamoyladenosine biosynthesis protein TsaB